MGPGRLVVLVVGLGSEAGHDAGHAQAFLAQHGVGGAHYLGVAAALPQLGELPHQTPSSAADTGREHMEQHPRCWEWLVVKTVQWLKQGESFVDSI